MHQLIVLGLLLLLINSCKKEKDTITDIDGNVYTSVTIGTQIWMVENLRTTTFNDGTSIPLITDNTAWRSLTSPGCCWYNNDIYYKKHYGALYSWYAVKADKLCPTGWHVPADVEWTTLENYLIANGYNYDGTTTENKTGKSLASTTNWNLFTSFGVVGDNPVTNNSSGFSAFPGGVRADRGQYQDMGAFAVWWTTTECDDSRAWVYTLTYDWWRGFITVGLLTAGFSVRCLKD